MSPSEDTSAEFKRVLDRARELELLLEQEFKALRARDLDTFEAAQSSREAILATIAAVTPEQIEAMKTHQLWDEIRSVVVHCHELHRRNEMLIQLQLQTIRSTLQALSGSQKEDETYDRLGKVARGRGQKWFNDV